MSVYGIVTYGDGSQGLAVAPTAEHLGLWATGAEQTAQRVAVTAVEHHEVIVIGYSGNIVEPYTTGEL